MIVVDNCILSSLSKIGRMDLLKHFKGPITSPGVVEEALSSATEAVIEGVSAALNDFLEVRIVSKHPDIPRLQAKYHALSYVDCELLLLCSEEGCPLLTDDSKLIRVAENTFHIPVYDLCDVFLALRRKKVLDRDEIAAIICDLERKDGYKFSKDDLLTLTK